MPGGSVRPADGVGDLFRVAPSNRSSSTPRTATIDATRSAPNAAASDLVGLERVDRLPQRWSGSRSIPRSAGLLVERGRVDVDRVGQRPPRLPARPPRRPAAQPAAGRGSPCRSKHLTSRFAAHALAARRAGDHPHRGLAVLQPPAGVGAGPVRRHQAQVADRARRTEGQQRGQPRQDPGAERRAVGGQPERPSPAAIRFWPSRHRLRCTWPPLPTPGTATFGENDVRRPYASPDRPDRRPDEHRGVGRLDRRLGGDRELELARRRTRGGTARPSTPSSASAAMTSRQ